MAATSTPARLRLMTDLKIMNLDSPDGCSASPLADEDLFIWGATIFGPSDTPWEGGIYSLRLTFTAQYPSKPPRVRFTSEMFHPNVYPDGTLCLDIIQDKWSPIYTISTILTSIQSLLSDPNSASPANPDAARMCVEDPKGYKRKVRRCAQRTLE
eukprot:CAMPEP_0184718638 /NCGR_PEP_ID=MMETSP0314-20130426/7776_1 /TAXON_ID=38298 /ORGANISM="Rhodella maculata, Strain CCMP 736" /LENGTH=154 /DNA_ID=CAMNT_0027182403 /DNA_START=164 /DNA_END=628 /DNA_ORIENTATION=-